MSNLLDFFWMLLFMILTVRANFRNVEQRLFSKKCESKILNLKFYLIKFVKCKICMVTLVRRT